MKAIKFNLSYGDERIKTLEELKDNCNIDMLLETLGNGLLVRWLTAQGKADLAQKVSAIKGDDKRKVSKELLNVLFDKDASALEQAAAELFAVREKEAARLESLKNLANKENEIIAQYHKGYDDTLASLKEKAQDYPALKVLMERLRVQYLGLLKLDKNHFYKEFKDAYPLVLLALMANRPLCDFFFDSIDQIKQVYEDVMPLLEINDRIEAIRLKIRNGERTPAVKLESEEQLQQFKEQNPGKVFVRIFEISSMTYFEHSDVHDFKVGDFYILEEDIILPAVKVFSGKTDSYWKDIEPKGKMFMIISMESGNKLRNAGVGGEELKAVDINGKFPITNGIDYMSNSESHKLFYMEV